MNKILFTFFYPLILILLVLFVSVFGYGQSYRSFEYEIEQIAEHTRWQIGPFRIYPTIRFKNIGYDDNVYYQREEKGPISDYTGTVSPEFKVNLLFHDYLILYFTENPEYVYYHEQKRERRWNNAITPKFKLLFLNRFVISGSYSHRNRRWRASSEFDVRANEKTQGYSGSFFYETARGTSLGFSGSTRSLSYADIALPGEEIYLSRNLNREERNGSFELYYRIFSESFLFVKGGYTEYRFEHEQAAWRNSSSYQVYYGIRFPLLGRVRGILSFGYKKLLPRKEGRDSFSGIVGNTSLDIGLGRFRFRLSYNRDCHFSYWMNNIFFNEDRYGAGVSFYLLRFLRIDYNLDYGRTNYPESTTYRVPDGRDKEIKRKDKYLAHTVGFVFRIIRDTGLGVRMSFWQRISNYHWENRKRMFIGGYVTYEF